MDILKYISWLLALGVSFSGAWLFTFTISDSETGRKKLTPTGRIGFMFAVLTAGFAFVSTINSDIKAKKQSEQSSIDKEAFSKYKKIAEKDRKETKKTLFVVHEKIIKMEMDVGNIPTGSKLIETKSKIMDDVKIESMGIEQRLKSNYPDLYTKYLNATTVGEIVKVVENKIDKDYKNRISQLTTCDVKFTDGDAWGRQEFYYFSIKINNDTILLNLDMSPAGTKLSVVDFDCYKDPSIRDWGKGYVVHLESGGKIKMLCSSPFKQSEECACNLSLASNGQEILNQLKIGIGAIAPFSDQSQIIKLSATSQEKLKSALECINL